MTRKEAHVLELLGTKEMTGLDLVKASEKITPWWSLRRLRRGSVYVVLQRMEEQDLVVRRVDPMRRHHFRARFTGSREIVARLVYST